MKQTLGIVGLLVLVVGLTALGLASLAQAESIDVECVQYNSGGFWFNQVDLDPCAQGLAMSWVNTASTSASCLSGGGMGWEVKGMYGEGVVYHNFGGDAQGYACVKISCLDGEMPPNEYNDSDSIIFARPTPGP